MTEIEYFEQLHLRLNHVQTMQNFVTNVISSAAVAVLIAFATLALSTAELAEGAITLPGFLKASFLPTYAIVMVVLLWAQLVSFYQTFCVFKLAKLLGELELRTHSDLGNARELQNPPYFPHRGMRRYYYALLHVLPALYLAIVPTAVLLAYSELDLDRFCTPSVFLACSLGIVFGVLLMWLLALFRIFYYRFPLLCYAFHRPGPSQGWLETARERAKSARKKNLAKIQAYPAGRGL
ncbi:hypothetical protein ACFLSZ_07160 [Candidatus Bipolaricaulota bacterium]